MKQLKTILVLLFSITILCLSVSCSKEADSKDNQGHPIRLSDYKGKWVLINYWATWCRPCLKEMPALNAIYQGNTNKLVVLGVSYDKLSKEEINAVAKQQAIKYPLLSTFPLKKLGMKRLDVLPITFIINPDGKLVKTLRGPQTEAQFRAAVGLAE